VSSASPSMTPATSTKGARCKGVSSVDACTLCDTALVLGPPNATPSVYRNGLCFFVGGPFGADIASRMADRVRYEGFVCSRWAKDCD
jgi:hypothetical protein